MMLIHFVAAAQHLKILLIDSFTFPTFELHKIPFSMKSQLLADLLLTKMKSKLFKVSFMTTGDILLMITNKFSMQVYILETKRFDGPNF